jgi:hypothetical protein
MGRFLPPDHSQGDERTIGGYMAVHARPAAFEGVDGASYSVAIECDDTGEHVSPWGAYLIFVRWSPGEPSPSGHLETGYLAHADTEEEARASVGALSLETVKAELDALIHARAGTGSGLGRPWWEAMHDADDDAPEERE